MVIVLDFSFTRCAWRALRRSREPAEFWWRVWFYRRRSLPGIPTAIVTHAPEAALYPRVPRQPSRRRWTALRQCQTELSTGSTDGLAMSDR
jgi:hypothetical protein